MTSCGARTLDLFRSHRGNRRLGGAHRWRFGKRNIHRDRGVVRELLYWSVIQLHQCPRIVRSKLVFSARLPRILRETLHKEPVELVFPNQPSVGFRQSKRVLEALPCPLVRIAECAAPALRAPRILTPEIENVTVTEAKIVVFVE